MSTLSALETLGSSLSSSERMPVLFIGHGSPMNAIEDNVYSQSWGSTRQETATSPGYTFYIRTLDNAGHKGIYNASS